MYDATLGRFLSRDPIGQEGGSIALYAYARGSPTDMVDPLGLRVIYRGVLNCSGQANKDCGTIEVETNWQVDAKNLRAIGFRLTRAAVPRGGVDNCLCCCLPDG